MIFSGPDTFADLAMSRSFHSLLIFDNIKNLTTIFVDDGLNRILNLISILFESVLILRDFFRDSTKIDVTVTEYRLYSA